MNRRSFLTRSAVATVAAITIPVSLVKAQADDETLPASLNQTWTRDFEATGMTFDGALVLKMAAAEATTESIAKEAYTNLVANITESYGPEFTTRKYSKLTDEGFLSQGEYTDPDDESSTAMLGMMVVREKKMVYTIFTGGFGEQATIVTGFYDILFDKDRKVDDVLLTIDEVPVYMKQTDETHVTNKKFF